MVAVVAAIVFAVALVVIGVIELINTRRSKGLLDTLEELEGRLTGMIEEAAELADVLLVDRLLIGSRPALRPTRRSQVK